MNSFSSDQERNMHDSDDDRINEDADIYQLASQKSSFKSDDNNVPYKRYYGGKGRFLYGKSPRKNMQHAIEDNDNEYSEELNEGNKESQDHNSCENKEENSKNPRKSSSIKKNQRNQENNNKETIPNQEEAIKKRRQLHKESVNEIDMMAEEFNENARMCGLLKEVNGTIDLDQNNSKNQNSIDIDNVLSRAEFEEDVIGRLRKFSQLKEYDKYENQFDAYKNSQLTNKLAFLNFQNNHRSKTLHEKVQDINNRLRILRENIESQLTKRQQSSNNNNNKEIKENKNNNNNNIETQATNDTDDNFWKSIKNEYECLFIETFMTGYNLGHDDDHKTLHKSQWRKKNAHEKEMIWRRSGGKREYKFQNEQKKCNLVKNLLNNSS